MKSPARSFRAAPFVAVLGLVAACNNGQIGKPVPDMAHDPNLDGFIHQPDEVDLAGFDFPPQLGTMYAHTGTTLYVVDPTSFDLTPIGDFLDPSDLGSAGDMTDLAVTPDGQIYTISRTSLYTVDANTGKATELFSGIATSNVALTFQNNGTLLAADQAGAMRSIDPSTGNITELGTYGTGYDTAGDLVAVADGTLFGVSTKAPTLGSTSNVLLKVNPSTAKATTVGQIGYTGVFGVAYSGGRVIAFTKNGEIIRIDPMTGQGTLVRTYPDKKFYGAGTSPLVPIL